MYEHCFVMDPSSVFDGWESQQPVFEDLHVSGGSFEQATDDANAAHDAISCRSSG